MANKMFGHRLRKKDPSMGRDPGLAPNFNAGRRDDNQGKAAGNPPNYEGKEHVRYKNPGYSSHHIRFPEDEPHMKSHVSRDETHEAEDDFHMDVPDQTEKTLPKKLKRAHMLMDSPNQENPKPIRGNPVHNVGYEGEMDTTGEEEMGPNDMQEGEGMPKERRKKMIVAVMKRKMKNRDNEPGDEGKEEEKNRKKFSSRIPY